MFTAPQPTPYDLCFRLFGFPVRVHPMFWVVMVLMGRTSLDTPHAAVSIGLWVLVGFVSILLHELGHAFAYRYYRCHGTQIWLYWFGGLAGSNQRPVGHWPNIFISLAGPVAQLILCGIVYLTNDLFHWATLGGIYTVYLYTYLFLINLFWPILNLLPVWPLDGGQVMREACFLMRLRKPEEMAMQVSLVTAIAIAAIGLLAEFSPAMLSGLPWWFPVPSLFGALLFGSLAYSAYENLQLLRSGPRYYG